MSEMAEAIRLLIQEKGYSEDSVRQTIERALVAAYKKTYGPLADNCVVVFADDMSDVSVYSRKTVVDGVYFGVKEIELEDALKLKDGVQIGDELLIPEDPKNFARSAVDTGKQTAHQGLNETLKKSLMDEYKDKIGEIIIGYHQRERNGNIYVDLGNAGRVEGFLPVKFQSKLEYYEAGDRIKALIVDVKPTNSGIQLILSRSDPKLVSSILEKEVPEIADGTVEIRKIVREAGYRTKLAVYSVRDDVDPVGACVGLKGVRIQNVIRELLNEKIDVLRYDEDPVEFIKNALSPAEVKRVVIMDVDKREALAIVEDSQFSLAIGKQGQNVRLANRLCNWNIDVKTEEQAKDIDFSTVTTIQNAVNIFNNGDEDEEDVVEITSISELPGVDMEVAEILKANGIDEIEDFVEAYDNDSLNVEGVSKEALDIVNELINENVEFVDEDDEAEEEADSGDSDETAGDSNEDQDDEEYFCPKCGTKITLDMTHCPNPECGVEFKFTDEE